MVTYEQARIRRTVMASLDTVSIGILLGALLVLVGILSSLIAMRFGAPLLLVFLLLGMLAGESGPGGIKFDDVRSTYVVGSIALALILFDGGLRTRLATFRSVLAPALVLATLGVLLTAALTAPVARYVLGMGWTEAFLVGAVVASTDAAAVFFLVHAKGLRLRPRVGAILEVESGINDPFAVFLTIVLVEFLLIGGDHSWQHVVISLASEAVLGTIIGIIGGRAMVLVLNRLGLRAGPARALRRHQRAGDLRAGAGAARLGVPRRLSGRDGSRQPPDAGAQHRGGVPGRRNLAGADRDVRPARPPRLAAGAAQNVVAGASRCACVDAYLRGRWRYFCCFAPFRFAWREKVFISWVGLRGAVGIFLASIPLLVGLPNAQVYFDIAFVVVLTSLLIQGWSIAWAARILHIALPRHDPLPRRVELDLPGQLEQEIVGYPVPANSPYLRRGLLPSWARPTLVVRDEKILSPGRGRAGARRAITSTCWRRRKRRRRSTASSSTCRRRRVPIRRCWEISSLPATTRSASWRRFTGSRSRRRKPRSRWPIISRRALHRTPKQGDTLPLGTIALVAHRVTDGRVTSVGLRLAEEGDAELPASRWGRLQRAVRRLLARLG